VGSAELAQARRSWQRGPERRAALAEAAARQFCRLGFYRVSMADVATEVGVTAPAIYRYFRSKQELLAAAISDGLDLVTEALDRTADAPLPDFMHAMAGVAITRRDLWILLQRELRQLSPAQRQPLEEQFEAIVRPFRVLVRRERPDLSDTGSGLVTTAILATLASPSVYRARMPKRDQQRILAAAAQAACHARWDPTTPPARPSGAPAVSPAPGRPAPGRPAPGRPAPGRADLVGSSPAHAPDRGAEVLDTAIRLFAARGYQAVSLDDIGAELGLAGPSLYHYYATKSDILVAAFARAAGWLAAQRGPAGQARSLDELVAAYIDLGVRERMVFAVYVWEAVNLPPEAGRRIRSGLEADVHAWCAALGEQRPGLTAGQRLVLVHAARAVVHDVVRIGHWHDRPDLAATLRGLVAAVLTAPLER
jgi:AcrR family transcriptional regulator